MSDTPEHQDLGDRMLNATEAAVLDALVNLDAEILASVTHLGSNPGDGLAEVLRQLIARNTGIIL